MGLWMWSYIGDFYWFGGGSGIERGLGFCIQVCISELNLSSNKIIFYTPIFVSMIDYRPQFDILVFWLQNIFLLSFIYVPYIGAVLLFDLFFHLMYQNFVDATTFFLVTNIQIWLDCNKALAFF